MASLFLISNAINFLSIPWLTTQPAPALLDLYLTILTILAKDLVILKLMPVKLVKFAILRIQPSLNFSILFFSTIKEELVLSLATLKMMALMSPRFNTPTFLPSLVQLAHIVTA